MSVWHGGSHKRKSSGGRRRSHRKKRRFERGSFPAETSLGERRLKKVRGRGGVLKVHALSENAVNVFDPKKGKAQNVKILRVINNPASVDYDRRGIITRGAIVETELGHARVTSRPGQHGMINAVLVPAGS
ncbi:MAG: 30S ribosomal protein S8e [Candidatus Bathyarchaeota archaeon]|nr:MAG: 30S ribosomal protein S8e [Candidatus Bathyarchaeota archaeon]